MNHKTVQNDRVQLWNKAAKMSLLYTGLFLLPLLDENLPMVETMYWKWFVAFSAVYQYLSIYFENFVLQHHQWVFSHLSAKAKETWPTPKQFSQACNTQFTGLVHAVLSSLGSVYLSVYPGALGKDHLFGTSYFSSLHGIHSCASFFTELLDLLGNGSVVTTYDKVILFHHLCGVVGFSMAAYGVGNWFSMTMLLTEISSIFLGFRWFALQFNFPKTRPVTYQIVEYGFVASFVLVRLGLGYFYMTPVVVGDLLPLALGDSINPNTFPLYSPDIITHPRVVMLARMILFMYAASHCMNLFFLYKIVGMAIKSHGRQSSSSGSKRPESEPLLRTGDREESPVRRTLHKDLASYD
ncbi:hypothetical protein HDV03_000664 [Kappamyces sp. JEL0829]|nr:hypothetical protein HDV03_000664 [Kappamyces sp. JEL0829]